MVELHYTVLLIEDNQGDVRLIQEMLRNAKSCSFSFESFERLEEGISWLENNAADAMLLDLSLPDSIGLDTLNRALERAENMPIVVLTGLEDQEAALQAVKSGAQDYLCKGELTPSLLERAVCYAVDRKKSEQELKQSYEKMNRILEQTVAALVSTLEKRDSYTAGHQARVARLSAAIALKLGFEKERVDGIGMAGLIHDIGKINIPIGILMKPSRLDKEEFNMIKTHPGTGYDTLKSVEFPWPIAHVVHQHHERLDGTGYPKGLKGDEIRIESRIIAVADVVEAMTAFRPYRDALGVDIALDEIRKGRGKSYDPDVVDACVELFEKGEFSFGE
ncbi:MAG: HD domain-containing phosphohydrolase [Pseudomonadota bacterium]